MLHVRPNSTSALVTWQLDDASVTGLQLLYKKISSQQPDSSGDYTRLDLPADRNATVISGLGKRRLHAS